MNNRDKIIIASAVRETNMVFNDIGDSWETIVREVSDDAIRHLEDYNIKCEQMPWPGKPAFIITIPKTTNYCTLYFYHFILLTFEAILISGYSFFKINS